MPFIVSLAVLSSLLFPAHSDMANYLIIEARKVNLPVVPVLMIVWQESKLDPLAFNPRDIDGKQKFGLLQYDTDTWRHLTKKMGMTLSIDNWRHQVQVFSFAVKNGEGWRWPSVKKVLEGIPFSYEGI